MNFENGEKRICPRKVARNQVTHVTMEPTRRVQLAYSRLKEGADVECDPNCPGAKLERRMLGPIPLPIQTEVCPMPEEEVGPDPSDAHSLSVLGQQ